jgi:hypothetical protein
MKLTDVKVRSLRANTNRYEVWETGRSGFGFRVSASSNKSLFYFYRFEGKNRRMTLGVYSEMTLEKAHSAHAKARDQLIKGLILMNY